jgi:hypothetical protein
MSLGESCPSLSLAERKIGADDRLGDRHGENILFDSLTGDTVHVDLNCLFDKVSPLSRGNNEPILM